MRIKFWIILIISTISFNIFGKKDTLWTPQDIIYQEQIKSAQTDPSGKFIIWYKTVPNKSKNFYTRDLYLTNTNTEKTIRLTHNYEIENQMFGNANSFITAPDGSKIYYILNKKGKSILFSIKLSGGISEVVDSFKTSISNIKMLGKDNICFISNENKNLSSIKKEQSKDDVTVIESFDEFFPTRIFSYNTKTKTVKRLTNNEYPIMSYAVSPNASMIITSHVLSPSFSADGKPDPEYYLWDLKNGKSTQILENSKFFNLHGFSFTNDNQGFYFINVKLNDLVYKSYGISIPYYFDIASMKTFKLPINWENGINDRTLYLDGNNLFLNLSAGPVNKPVYIEKKDLTWKVKQLNNTDFNNNYITLFNVKKNIIVYSVSNASKSFEFKYSFFENGKKQVDISEGKTLAKINSHLNQKPKAKTEIIYWTGALNEKVNGILYYPLNYDASKQYPLVVAIHGGPAAVDQDNWNESWAYTPHLYAQKGAFVLMPNYHGSGNHGLDFLESIKKRYYDYELLDIVRGIDYLNTKGLIKMDKLATVGWSNGAILSTALTVEYPDLFKAAISGSGDVNWTSDYGRCRFGVTFDQSYFGGAPWDNVNGKTYNEAYILKSPLFEMEKVTTPTLIIMGSDDDNVPRDQAWEHYRALQQIGKTDVRFIWIPGEKHVLNKISHRLRKVDEEIAWLDKYLFDTNVNRPKTIKEGSPISLEMQKNKLKSHQGNYGIFKDGILQPELITLEEGKTQIGKLEITNAQYKEFYPAYNYPKGQANYPAYSITVENIESYLIWLTKKTGRKYRLPNKIEAQKLEKLAKKNILTENNLNMWAGYEVPFDELELFKQETDILNLQLIKSVGSYKPIKFKDQFIYDLGGNVSEYYKDGTQIGKFGFSAYDYYDSYSSDLGKLSNHTGFRVVKTL